MNLVVQLQDVFLSVMEGKWIILKAQICSSEKDNSSITGEDLAYAEAVSLWHCVGAEGTDVS